MLKGQIFIVNTQCVFVILEGKDVQTTICIDFAIYSLFLPLSVCLSLSLSFTPTHFSLSFFFSVFLHTISFTLRNKYLKSVKKNKHPFLLPFSIPVLAASGKLDKKALPAFDSQLMDGVGAEGRPSTVTEVALAEMWIDVLRLKEIDIQESFFDLGGWEKKIL